MEIGVLPNCNPHRHLAYAVQQIIAQELEVERLKRASISMGLDGHNLSENTNSEKSEITKNNKDNKDKSPNPPNDTKSGKSATSLKEVVSLIHLFSYIIHLKDLYIVLYYVVKQYILPFYI